MLENALKILRLYNDSFNTSYWLTTLKSPLRNRDVVLVRNILFFVLYRHGYTLKEVGEFFNRTHSAVIHGIRTVECYKEDNARLLVIREKIKENPLNLDFKGKNV